MRASHACSKSTAPTEYSRTIQAKLRISTHIDVWEVTVGGKNWEAFNATEETVTFDRNTTGLDDIVATFA